MTPDSETLIEQLQCVRAATPTQQVVVDDAITALRAVQWRPISEAPKDKPVIGKFSETHIEGVTWAGDYHGPACPKCGERMFSVPDGGTRVPDRGEA